MIAFPNCKINLGLRIIRKRDDGFHDLETIFYPLPLHDVLEILPAANRETHFISTGLSIPGDEDNNLCIKAYRLLKNEYPHLPPVQMHLHKKIAMGAGLGGGSSDASFALVLLNDIFQLGIENEKLESYAIRLGSDCPFFIRNKICYASGRGEVLEEIDLDLTEWNILLVHPGIHIDTGWAFSQITPFIPSSDLHQIIRMPIAEWKYQLVNDFEEVCMRKHPLLSDLKQQLYNIGAAYVSMSGSGSSYYGLFPKTAGINTGTIGLPFTLVPA